MVVWFVEMLFGLVYWHLGCLIDCFIDVLFGWLFCSHTVWLVVLFTCCLFVWLVGWFVDMLFGLVRRDAAWLFGLLGCCLVVWFGMLFDCLVCWHAGWLFGVDILVGCLACCHTILLFGLLT